MHRFKKRIAELGLLLMILGAPLSAQEVDGLVQQPDSLVGQDIVVQPLKGTIIDSQLNGVVPSQKGHSDVMFLKIERNGKTKLKADQVESLKLGAGSLNGILNATNLPGQRQLVCKLIAAHLNQANPVAFGQMLEMLKQGRSTNEVLNICYGIDQRALANSFGKSISIPGLSP